MHEHSRKLFLVLIVLLLLVTPALAGTDWTKEKNRIFNQVEDWKAEGDRALQGGDYEDALGAYNQAISRIQSSPLSESDKNAQLATLYNKKSETYLLRGQPGDDALSKEASLKADSYKNAHSGSLIDMFPCFYTSVTAGTGAAGAAQELRDFRTNAVYSSYSGTQFLNAFYPWYYSFSPDVVQFTRTHPSAEYLVQIFITPSLGILITASRVYPVLAFSPELAVIATGLVASAMIGMVYGLLPALAVLHLARRYPGISFGSDIFRIAGGIWIAGILCSGAGIVLRDPVLTAAGTVTFVVTTGIISAGLAGTGALIAATRITRTAANHAEKVSGRIA